MKKRVICAAACALAVALSTTGCADTSWAMKSGNITLPTGVYVYYLLNNAAQVEQQAASSSSTSTSSAVSDPWSQTMDGTSAPTWAINNAISSCQTLIYIEQQCASRKITLTSSEQSSAKSSADSNYSSYESIFTNNGISETSVERVSTDMALSQKLFDSIYGSKGEKAVSESDLESYYTKNYVHIKQIFINKQDSTTGATLTGAKLTAATNKANTAFAAVKANKANFDALVKKYNEDPGMTSNPDGYIFSESTASSDSYDTSFVSEAFSLKVGDVGMTQSSMGYFIEYRVALDPKASTFSTYKEGVLAALKGTEYTTMLTTNGKKVTATQNKAALNHYDPKKLNLSTSST